MIVRDSSKERARESRRSHHDPFFELTEACFNDRTDSLFIPSPHEPGSGYGRVVAAQWRGTRYATCINLADLCRASDRETLESHDWDSIKGRCERACRIPRRRSAHQEHCYTVCRRRSREQGEYSSSGMRLELNKKWRLPLNGQ